MKTSQPNLEEFDAQHTKLLDVLPGYLTDSQKSQLIVLRSTIASRCLVSIRTLFREISNRITVTDVIDTEKEREHVLDVLQKAGYKVGRRNRVIRPK